MQCVSCLCHSRTCDYLRPRQSRSALAAGRVGVAARHQHNACEGVRMISTAHTNDAGLFESASATCWRRVLVAAITGGAWQARAPGQALQFRGSGLRCSVCLRGPPGRSGTVECGWKPPQLFRFAAFCLCTRRAVECSQLAPVHIAAAPYRPYSLRRMEQRSLQLCSLRSSAPKRFSQLGAVI